MYTPICATYEVTGINHMTMGIVHIFYISLNKYGCHIICIYVQVHCYGSAPIDPHWYTLTQSI